MKILNVFFICFFQLFEVSVFARQAFPETPSIDILVAKALERENIASSGICSDPVFIRRLSLDITGKLPEIESVRRFIRDSDTDKRSKLIDSLLGSEAFVDYQVLKWGDLLRCKSEFPSNLWPNAVQAYARWMHECISQNRPYDQMTKELLLSSGSNFRSPEVNFYRAFQQRTGKNIAESVGLLFLGMRPLTKFEGNHHTSDFSPFFDQIRYKKSGEWKEELVYVDKDISPTGYGVKMPDGNTLYINSNTDFRVGFVNWLTDKKNPFFARVMANRVWFWLMGRGIVDEPDNFSALNPPSNPELLSYLEKEFTDHAYDLKYLFRLILNSETYQRSSVTTGNNGDDHKYFSHYLIRRLTAEQLLDAICDITGMPEIYSSRAPEPYTFLPKDTRAVQIVDGTISNSFLELFGRPSRDISYESDRDNNLTMKQDLYLINSTQLSDKVKNSPRLKWMTDHATSNRALVDELYLLILSRYPIESERSTILPFLSANDKSQAVNDLVWSLINGKEFVFNH